MHGHFSFRFPLVSFAGAIGISAMNFGALSGCHETSSHPVPLQVQTVTLAVGQNVSLATGLVLSFDRVISDSRCPKDVACVWEGEVTIALALSGSAGAAFFTLSDHASTLVVSGHSFTLQSVQPLPNAGSSIPEASYRVTVRVERSVH